MAKRSWGEGPDPRNQSNGCPNRGKITGEKIEERVEQVFALKPTIWVLFVRVKLRQVWVYTGFRDLKLLERFKNIFKGFIKGFISSILFLLITKELYILFIYYFLA